MCLIEKTRKYKGTVVLRENDYGKPPVFWFVPMKREEFKLWWMNQETFDDNPPGKNAFEDSLLKTPEGKYLYHKGYCGEKRD